MIVSLLGTVLRIDTRLVKGGLTRVEALLDIGVHDSLIGSNQVLVSTIDPFAADTLKAAKDSGRKVWVDVRNSQWGYQVLSTELHESQRA